MISFTIILNLTTLKDIFLKKLYKNFTLLQPDTTLVYKQMQEESCWCQEWRLNNHVKLGVLVTQIYNVVNNAPVQRSDPREQKNN